MLADRRALTLFISALLASAFVCPNALAQRGGRLEIKNEKLTTKDGVELHITYYPSGAGKRAVPVVIIHDLKETRQSYSDLAKSLWQPTGPDGQPTGSPGDKFAVITVDLRGHGESVSQSLRGRTRELSAAKLRGGDYVAMVTQDMEAVRRFLVTQNDAGKLNLNALSVVGVGLGAAVGMNWTAADWAAPPLATGKQGQDVKSLVMVSPRWKEDLPVVKAVQQPGLRREVAVLMMYGSKDRRVNADVERIDKQLARDRTKSDTPGERFPDLMKAGVDTDLQGAEWLKQAGEKGVGLISGYLEKHSVEPDFPWSERRQFD
ncbi:Alpha/beta hydrolase family protein [Posidoniimonas polymericola]|uniref:Alpha/beta hydrolase family protein n=1 Tax=Posidoniimonas polymericola TaxID=2528002 RepID=A0A5C5YSR1_9BACT|nr:alpha/beta fold hydrolase [Posidoniimonas polymericola]TWT78032.1 Alpha/beta hydrolase family protein [Posidoniimonas polymericola]